MSASVDFPAPFGPTTTVADPAGTVNSSPVCTGDARWRPIDRSFVVRIGSRSSGAWRPGNSSGTPGTQTPAAASEPAKPAGRANGDGGGKDSSTDSKTHQHQGS